MNNEAQELIEQKQVLLRAERKLVADLESRLKNDSMKQLLKRAANSLDDIEQIFLRSAEQERRTSDALRKWLGFTDVIFHIAAQQRRVVEDAVSAYGSDVVAVYPS